MEWVKDVDYYHSKAEKYRDPNGVGINRYLYITFKYKYYKILIENREIYNPVDQEEKDKFRDTEREMSDILTKLGVNIDYCTQNIIELEKSISEIRIFNQLYTVPEEINDQLELFYIWKTFLQDKMLQDNMLNLRY